MSRRNDTSVPEYQPARKTPIKVKVDHAALHPLPELDLSGTRTSDAGTAGPSPLADFPATPPAPSNLGRFATKEELAEVFLRYERGSGICPLCGVKMKKLTGIYGHISKCLRLQKSKIASTAIS